MFALNQGEVCTCPSRALIQRGHYSEFLDAAIARTETDRAGPPAGHGHDDRRAGLQRPAAEDPLLPGHRPAGGREGPDGRSNASSTTASWRAATTSSRPSSRATTGCGSSRRRSSARSSSVTSFADFDDAIRIAERHAVRPRAQASGPGTSTPRTARAARSRQAGSGRTATTPTRRTRPSAATSSPGIGRENHKMMLEHYQQTKNLLVSYSPKKLGLLLEA